MAYDRTSSTARTTVLVHSSDLHIDDDCQPGCGNNVVESGETCDPLASCPTSCQSNGCQFYDVANPGTCQATCVPGAIQTACQNSDGCCPAGCNAISDSDCPAVCGNNVVEPGETCDGDCPRCAETSSCYTQSGDATTCAIEDNAAIIIFRNNAHRIKGATKLSHHPVELETPPWATVWNS